jgi:hypothetical protein
MIFHGALSIDEATEEKVAELFGGGKFRAQLMVRNPDGLEVVQRSQDFRLPGAYMPPMGKLPGIGPVPIAGVNAGAGPVPEQVRGGGSISPNEALNQVLIHQVLDVVKAARETKPSYEPILAFATVILPPLIEGIFSRKGDDHGAEVRAALDEMRRELASLRNQPGPVTAGIGDAVKAIRELVEVRDVITGGGGDGDGGEKGMMWKMAGEALKVLAGQQPSPAASQAPPSRIPGRTEVPVQGPPRPMWEQMLLHYRPQLLETIRRGVAPEFAADIAMQFMEPNVEGIVIEFVKRADHVQLAAQVIPELAEFPSWSEGFWKAIREGMAGEPEKPEGEEPPAD